MDCQRQLILVTSPSESQSIRETSSANKLPAYTVDQTEYSWMTKNPQQLQHLDARILNPLSYSPLNPSQEEAISNGLSIPGHLWKVDRKIVFAVTDIPDRSKKT